MVGVAYTKGVGFPVYSIILKRVVASGKFRVKMYGKLRVAYRSEYGIFFKHMLYVHFTFHKMHVHTFSRRTTP